MTSIHWDPNRYGDLSALSDDELEDLLHQEMHREDDSDGETLREIGKILASRDPQEFVEAQASWARFAARYLDTPSQTDELESSAQEDNLYVLPKKRRHSLGFAITAAIISVLLIGTAVAVGTDFFDVIYDWGKEHLTYSISSGDAVTPTDISREHVEVAEELKPLQEALEERGITASLLPTYFPEGYESLGLGTSDSESGSSLVLSFQSGDEIISLGFTWFTRDIVGGVFEKDDGDPVIYKVNDASYYIITNIDEYLATWTCGKINCFISSTSEEELYKMLDSIP